MSEREHTAGAPLPLFGNTLPVGHMLNEFAIEGLIGEGGFSLVYLARDTHLQRVVAIKEYMPSGLASRNDDHSVSVRSQRYRETFELGLRSFVNEARLLASFDHPALVKVYRFWEQNGTAYMVMPYYQGRTLKQWLAEREQAPDEAWLKALLAPLLDALEAIHADSCYHRDIAPDNILLLGPDRPLLLDFGAARRVIGDATQALTIILKPGYAPVEQYAEVPGMKQGAWTDVYALCAVLYRAISGAAPAPSVGRLLKDGLVPAAQLGAGRYSHEFLAAIDAGLAVQPAHRPQSIAALRAAFFEPEAVIADDTLTQQLDEAPTVMLPGASKRGATPRAREATPRARDAAPRAHDATPRARDELVADPASRPDRARRDAAATASPQGASKRAALWTSAAVGGLVLAAGGWWVLAGPARAPAPSPLAVAPPAPAAAPAPAASTPRASATEASAEPSPVASPAPAREPFSVRAALEELARQADPQIAVELQAGSARLVIGRDEQQFRIRSTAPGYLYVFLANADGTQLYRFFPNEYDRANRVAANQELRLPRKFKMTADGPPGIDRILAVVSQHPRDFANTGLRTKDSLYDLKVAERLWNAPSGSAGALLGTPTCAAAPCSERFGAALAQYEVVAR